MAVTDRSVAERPSSCRPLAVVLQARGSHDAGITRPIRLDATSNPSPAHPSDFVRWRTRAVVESATRHFAATRFLNRGNESEAV